MTTTLITGGTVVSATGRAAADVLVDGETHRRRARSRAARCSARMSRHPSTASSTRPASTSSPAASTRTRTCSCRSAAPRPPTPSRPARARRPGAARRRSSTSPCRPTARRSQDGLAAWHEKAAGNCAIDYGFHQIVGDVDDDSLDGDARGCPTRASRASSCSWPTRASSTRDDAQILRGDAGRPRHGHAHDDARRERPGHRRARRSSSSTQGKTDPYYHGIARAWQMEEEATHRAIMLAEAHRRAALRRAREREAGRRAARLGARQRPERLRRDLPAVPLPLARGAARRHRATSGAHFEGAKWVCSTPLRSHGGGPPARDVAGAAHERPADGLDRPLPVLHEGPEGARPGRLPQDPQRHRLDRAPHGPHVPGRRRPARSRSSAGSSSRAPRPRACSASTARRASSSRAPTPTSSSTTRTGHTSIGVDKTHHMNMDHSAWEGYEIDGHVDTVLSRGKVIVDDDEYLGAKGDGRFLKRGLSQYLV